MSPDLEREILAALRAVDDPELGVNVVDLGLVVALADDGDQVAITLMTTTPTCPLGRLIAETAAAAVGRRIGPDRSVRVTIDRTARWTPERADPAVRARFQRRPFGLGAALKAGFARLRGAA